MSFFFSINAFKLLEKGEIGDGMLVDLILLILLIQILTLSTLYKHNKMLFDEWIDENEYLMLKDEWSR